MFAVYGQVLNAVLLESNNCLRPQYYYYASHHLHLMVVHFDHRAYILIPITASSQNVCGTHLPGWAYRGAARLEGT